MFGGVSAPDIAAENVCVLHQKSILKHLVLHEVLVILCGEVTMNYVN